MLAIEKAAQHPRTRANRRPQPRIAANGANERTSAMASTSS